MTDEQGDSPTKLMQALDWAMAVEPSDCKARVEALRRAYPKANDRQLAQRFVSSQARRGGLEGFATGLLTNPFVMVPGALVDLRYILRVYAIMTAVVGHINNPNYFDDPDWETDAYATMLGAKVVSQALRDVGVAGGKQTTKVLIRKYLSKEVLKAIKRWVLKYLGRRVTQRALIAKIVPVIGGIIGGSWNFVEIRVVGKRVIRYHFDGELANEGANLGTPADGGKT
jgi:hypothetical protein